MIEFWIVVKEAKPKPGVPFRKRSGVDLMGRYITEKDAVESAQERSSRDSEYVYAVMHTIRAFGIEQPKPVELPIESVPASMLPDPPRDDEEEEEDDPWEDDDDQ